MNRASFAVIALAAGFVTAPAWAATENFTATLNTASEVPPKTTGGTGTMQATFDTATKVLTYTLTYAGLTGPATAAHIHGPAEVGKNAGVMVPFASPASPIKGTATLTDAQVQALESGMTYANVHTAANPAGEIRGQITKK